MAPLHLVPVIDAGLGNSSYVLGIGRGRALVMDPERDLRQVRATAQRLGLTIAYAAETHLHADFISGVRELHETEGATVLGPVVGPREFAHTGLDDGDSLDLGDFTLRALATPGHSPEHLSYLLLDHGCIVGVFTGGSLMVGAAGRTDLVSPDMTVPLARAQYHSLHRLMELPDDTPVWPTHGAGSFCSAGASGDRTTTISRERATNPLLQVVGEDAFVDALLGSLGTFPDYFLRPAFATWLGWLADPERPIIIVRGPDQNLDDIVWAAANVGFDRLAGEVAGGFPAWKNSSAAATAATGPLIEAERLVAGAEASAAVVDIRQASEYAAGHAAAARNFELGSLADRLSELPAGPLVVMCGHSERAMSAASILERAGRANVAVLNGGASDWACAAGRALELSQ